jgi:hypothetical protein
MPALHFPEFAEPGAARRRNASSSNVSVLLNLPAAEAA